MLVDIKLIYSVSFVVLVLVRSVISGILCFWDCFVFAVFCFGSVWDCWITFFFECREKKGGREVGLMGDNYYGMGFSKGYLFMERG